MAGVDVEGTTVKREKENPVIVKVEEEEEPYSAKLDDATVVKEEGDQFETKSTERNNDTLVSCMSACLKCCAQRTDTQSCPCLLMSNI
jgi:hypothetical protein